MLTTSDEGEMCPISKAKQYFLLSSDTISSNSYLTLSNTFKLSFFSAKKFCIDYRGILTEIRSHKWFINADYFPWANQPDILSLILHALAESCQITPDIIIWWSEPVWHSRLKEWTLGVVNLCIFCFFNIIKNARTYDRGYASIMTVLHQRMPTCTKMHYLW